jgi:class 3 adenylate cyclase/tetratricopeptide (TPR) repeat protein
LDDLALWLGKIGLSRYLPVFEQNDIDFRALRVLSDQDLQDLGLSLGHRRILLDAIAQLSDNKRVQVQRPTEAERRQLTVMFCDLAGSSKLSEQFDAEDVREIIRAYRHACLQPIQDFGGSGQRFIGDGILAFFGYPQAHEDDAERAIRAGLGIIESMERLNVAVGHHYGVRLQVRIGIATGLVVVGDIATEASLERSAVVGGAANLAARLQEVAEADTIVVAPETRLLASRQFQYRDLGNRSLKGFDRIIGLSQVVSERHSDDLEAGRTYSPLIGRDREMTALLDLWRQVETGQGQVAVICGKAGIGKSCLASALLDRVSALSVSNCIAPVSLVFRCSPHHRNAALHPIIRRLQQLASIERAEANEIKIVKLHKMLEAVISDDDRRLIADLLGLVRIKMDQPSTISPREKRQRTLEALEGWIRSIALQRPLLLLFEDAQWLDPTTKLFLGRLMDRCSEARILILVTVRTESTDGEQPGLRLEDPWLRGSNVNVCSLSEFQEREARQLLLATAHGRAIPLPLIKVLVRKAEGNPLYIEELTKGVITLLDQEPSKVVIDPLAPIAIPTTLSGYLMARLDQVGSARETAGHAAVIGHEFSFDFLTKVSELSVQRLHADLGCLVRAELIRSTKVSGAEVYEFKHALIRDAAYQSLLLRKRREIHLKIAEHLEGDGGANADLGDVIGDHYRHSGMHARAVAAWERAAAAAIQRAAQVEATNLLEKALTSVAELPNHQALKLRLTMQLASALGSIRGVADQDVEKAYLQARALCGELGESGTRFSIEFGLMMASFVKGDLWGADRIAKSLFALAEHHPKKPLVDAYLANGMVQMQFGRFEEARAVLEKAAALSCPARDEPHLFTHGLNPGIFCRSYLAHVLAFMGDVDQALDIIERNLTVAQERARDPSHLYSYVDALAFAGRVYLLFNESRAVKHLSNQLFTISKRNHYVYFAAIGRVQEGWSLAKEGALSLGVHQMCEGLAALEQTGTGLGARGFYVQIADFEAQLGEKERASATLRKAEGPEGSGTHVWDAEIERVRGEIATLPPAVDLENAEASFSNACRIARSQKAKTLELRAALSQARFLIRQRRSDEAGKLLSSVVNQYPCSRDISDVTAARLLLSELRMKG